MYIVAIVTISDKAFAGEREDASGQTIAKIIQAAGYTLSSQQIIPDDYITIQNTLIALADAKTHLVLTTGGTGFSPRDVTPEATTSVIERPCPGIPEAMRSMSMAVTKRALLTRSTAGIRGQTLIVNLPGSPKAVKECLDFIFDTLGHGLDVLTGNTENCAR